MELYINYLHRELTETMVSGRRRRVVDFEAQRLFDDYEFKILFDDVTDGHGAEDENGGNTDETGIFKQMVQDAVIRIYNSHASDRMTRLAYPSDGEDAPNCIALRFDDEDEDYGQSVYFRLDGAGWMYYNFPPFGIRHGNSNVIDPRTIIDGLLSAEGIAEHITGFEIRYRDVTWIFDRPEKTENRLSAASITIVTNAEDVKKEYVIQNAAFEFPYRDRFDRDDFINEQITDFTTKFAILTEGEYKADGETVSLNLKTHRQFTTDDEIMYVLTGNMKLVRWAMEDLYGAGEETEADLYLMDFNGDFVSNGIKKNYGFVSHGYEVCSYLGVYPLCVRLNDNDMDFAGENLVAVFSDFDKLADEEDGCESLFVISVSEYDYEYDYEKYIKEYNIWEKRTDRAARLSAFRTADSVGTIESELFGDTEIESCNLSYYERDEEGFENWVIEYKTKKNSVTVFYSSEEFGKGGISAKRVEIRSLAVMEDGNDTEVGISCDLNVSNNKVLSVREVFVSGKLQTGNYAKTVETDIRQLEEVSSVRKYFEEKLYDEIGNTGRKKKKSKPVSTAKSDSDTPKAETPFNRFHNYETIRQANGALDGTLKTDGDINPKFESLRFYLSSDKNKNLSYPENTLHEIAECITEWIPVMDRAKELGISVREHLESETEFEMPPIQNLVIMGEAGTGKTTLATKLAETCIGANMLTVLGGELKGVYIGWTKVSIGMKIFQLQKGTSDDMPAVLFIDEAYGLFEQTLNGEKGSGEVIEFLLKIAEPGEYIIDFSELDGRDLKKMGLKFTSSTKEGYEDEECFDVSGSGSEYEVTVKKIRKRKNTVIWLGGYEERLRKSFLANEGLNRRFSMKIIIPTPKMDELVAGLKRECPPFAAASGKAEKEVKNFLTWATSRSRSHLFGNYAGIKALSTRISKEIVLMDDLNAAILEAVTRYKNELEKQYKTELMRDMPQMPFEVVTQVDCTLDQYAGNERLKRRIENVIDMMIRSEEYRDMNISLPKGALLMGPPGTGKTMIARCMAGELQERINKAAVSEKNQKDVAFIPTSGAEILSTPNPVKAISALFSEAAAYDSAVIFIDEIDAIGKDRNRQNNIAPLLQLMKEMDGFGGSGSVFILAATNDPDSLDEALIRDNRFDIRLEVGLPDKKSSISLIDMYLEQYGFKYNALAERHQRRILTLLGGFAPASVKADLNEAAILYHQSERLMQGLTDEKIENEYVLELAHRRNLDGTYRRSEEYDGFTISDFELFLLDLKEAIDIKEIGQRNDTAEEDEFTIDPETNGSLSSVAIHEVGHALVRMELGYRDIERITILGRGNALGYVQYKNGASFNGTKKGFLHRIECAMGGRVAEELIYGPENISAGASQDIQDASFNVRKMVNMFGFSDEVGFIGIERMRAGYLGTEITSNVSEETRADAEREQSRILKECYEKVRKILTEDREILIAISEELFNFREITGLKMEEIYNKHKNK